MKPKPEHGVLQHVVIAGSGCASQASTIQTVARGTLSAATGTARRLSSGHSRMGWLALVTLAASLAVAAPSATQPSATQGSPIIDTGSRSAARTADDPSAVMRLPVGTASGATLSLMEALPRRRSVLILIDPDAHASQQWLQTLEASGYRGYGALVLVLDRPGAATATAAVARESASPKQAALLGQLPEATWLHSQAGPALTQLQVASSPQVIGFDANQQLLWRQSPRRGDSEQLILRLLDWVLGPGRSAIGSVSAQ